MDTNLSKTTVYAALAGNTLSRGHQAAAAAWTCSSSMLSEGIHSIVDTGNEILLLYGYRRAERPPDSRHPLGYGRELYFWSFIVALLLFALGAGAALDEGVAHILAPVPVRNVLVNYVVLGLAFLFEAGSSAGRGAGFSSCQGRCRMVAGGPRQQGSAVLHGPARGQCCADRDRHRRGEPGAGRRDGPARARRRGRC